MTDTPTDLTKPVRTRNGLDVRILCTDAPGPDPVKGYRINRQGVSFAMEWDAQGKYLVYNKFDLVNIPETTKFYHVVTGEGICPMARSKENAAAFAGPYAAYSIIELTYEGDKLTAVKIVEDE